MQQHTSIKLSTYGKQKLSENDTKKTPWETITRQLEVKSMGQRDSEKGPKMLH
jgi:hypothetical protein